MADVQCAALECRRPGRWVPIIEIPDLMAVIGVPRVPIRIHVPLAHCATHKEFVTKSDLLGNPEIRAEAERYARESKITPDWLAARVVWQLIRVAQDHAAS